LGKPIVTIWTLSSRETECRRDPMEWAEGKERAKRIDGE